MGELGGGSGDGGGMEWGWLIKSYVYFGKSTIEMNCEFTSNVALLFIFAFYLVTRNHG